MNFSFYGGPSAQRLKEEIEKYHSKSFQTMDELIQQSKETQLESEKRPSQQIGETNQTPKTKKSVDEKTFEEEFFAN